MDWVHIYYVVYLTANFVHAACYNGRMQEMHWGSGVAMIVFHIPMIGRIFGYW
jgi:hypothetical protein